MNRAAAFSTLAVCLTAACVHTSAVMVDPNAAYAPHSPDEVFVYLSERDVPDDFVPIAVIYAHGEHDLTDEADLIEAMREKAAKIGAHAIVLEFIEEPSTAAKVARVFLDTEADRRARVMAIRFVEPEAAVRPPPRR